MSLHGRGELGCEMMFCTPVDPVEILIKFVEEGMSSSNLKSGNQHL